MTSTYYKGVHGVIIVYDVTCQASFKNVESWVNEVNEKADPGVLKILIGNKTDLEPRQVPQEDVRPLVEKLRIDYYQESNTVNNGAHIHEII